MQYLIYQQAGGKPVAVFTETEAYFDPNSDVDVEGLRETAHRTRGPQRSWSDWVESLVDSTPSRWGKWNAVTRRDQALPVLLRSLQASTVTQ